MPRRLWPLAFLLLWSLSACARENVSPLIVTQTLVPQAFSTATQPAAQATEEVSGPSMPSTVVAPVAATPTAVAPTLPERRRLNLDWPTQLRVGDGDWVILTLEVDTQGNVTPTVSAAGHTTTGEVVEIPNLYETHFVQAEARLDIAGMQIAPQGEVIEPLQPGARTTFRWSVRATDAGVYRGTVSLHLRFVPKTGGAEQRMALRVLPITIEARTLVGLNGQWARLLGWIGSLIGSVLGLGDILPFLLDLFHRREK